ncbi:hypothetical protein [Paucisalibacillus globulus]|uniref:hypothetical protein n=1 Tax=Paucisalibacillus globulus TaxID=351095 RepID=UPI000BB99DA1|nr:hypothetical protein [Paucisalibacillus globulus]
MTEQERLKEIKELLAERDKYANVDGETDYSNYDKYITILNDDGHIDWMVERLEHWKSAFESENKIAGKLQSKLEKMEKELLFTQESLHQTLAGDSNA